MMNMNLLAVVTPPSIYHCASSHWPISSVNRLFRPCFFFSMSMVWFCTGDSRSTWRTQMHHLQGRLTVVWRTICGPSLLSPSRGRRCPRSRCLCYLGWPWIFQVGLIICSDPSILCTLRRTWLLAWIPDSSNGAVSTTFLAPVQPWPWTPFYCRCVSIMYRILFHI